MKNKIAIRASNNIEENKEIIKILESLGGENKYLVGSTHEHSCYYIGEDNLVYCVYLNRLDRFLKDYKLYTLEEYKKEFMENKEMKIIPPEGYEIDKENSTFKKIVFKKIEEKLTYEKIIKELFNNKIYYYTNEYGTIEEAANLGVTPSYVDLNNAPTKYQLERLLAINKLMNVAYYLNDGWEPDWSDLNERKYHLLYDHNINKIIITACSIINCSVIYFKSNELAKQAIEILGEETIKLALGVI